MIRIVIRPSAVRLFITIVATVAFAFAGGRFTHAEPHANKAGSHEHGVSVGGDNDHGTLSQSGNQDHRDSTELHCGAPILAAADTSVMVPLRRTQFHTRKPATALMAFGVSLDPPPPRFPLRTV